jgi:hypothetical protein
MPTISMPTRHSVFRLRWWTALATALLVANAPAVVAAGAALDFVVDAMGVLRDRMWRGR